MRETLLRLQAERVAMQRELDEAKVRIAQLERLADEDSLAPIANRRAFVRELSRMIAFTRRYGPPSSVVYFPGCQRHEADQRHARASGGRRGAPPCRGRPVQEYPVERHRRAPRWRRIRGDFGADQAKSRRPPRRSHWPKRDQRHPAALGQKSRSRSAPLTGSIRLPGAMTDARRWRSKRPTRRCTSKSASDARVEARQAALRDDVRQQLAFDFSKSDRLSASLRFFSPLQLQRLSRTACVRRAGRSRRRDRGALTRGRPAWPLGLRHRGPSRTRVFSECQGAHIHRMRRVARKL